MSSNGPAPPPPSATSYANNLNFTSASSSLVSSANSSQTNLLSMNQPDVIELKTRSPEASKETAKGSSDRLDAPADTNLQRTQRAQSDVDMVHFKEYLKELERINDPVSFEVGQSVEDSKKLLLTKVHRHPVKGIADDGLRTVKHPSRPIIVDDQFRLAQIKFNINKLVHAYPIQWASASISKKKLQEDICKKALLEGEGKLYNDSDYIELLRLRYIDLPFRLSFRTNTEIESEPRFTDFLNRESTDLNLKERSKFQQTGGDHDRWEDWYVVFSDQRMFVYCHTDRFASEEITAVEHPVLGSVREALTDFSTHGIFKEPPSFGRWMSPIGLARLTQDITGKFVGYNPLDVNYDDFYIPKDKSKADFRYEEIGPFTRDMAHRPTPCILMNVPLVCKINAGPFYGPAFKNGGIKAVEAIIKGPPIDRSKIETKDELAKAEAEKEKKAAKIFRRYSTEPFKVTSENSEIKLVHDGYAFRDIFDLSEPLPMGEHVPVIHPINRHSADLPPNARRRVTNNLVVMSSLDQLFNPLRARIGPYTIYQIRFIFRTAYTAFKGLMETARKQAREKMKNNPDVKWTPRVILHTGFWGCGSFGGNPKIMSYLQMVAAAAAGVDKLYIHHTGKKAECDDVDEAKRWYEEDIVRGASRWVPKEGEASSSSSAVYEEERPADPPGSVVSSATNGSGNYTTSSTSAPQYPTVTIDVEKLFRRLEAKKVSWGEGL
ncbi:hypothetical protein HDU96_008473 [Phlyctochytrium bullatum]|nr:hypothetical protein HDU96_008473 [Phlyctochytrium bullatum]